MNVNQYLNQGETKKKTSFSALLLNRQNTGTHPTCQNHAYADADDRGDVVSPCADLIWMPVMTQLDKGQSVRCTARVSAARNEDLIRKGFTQDRLGQPQPDIVIVVMRESSSKHYYLGQHKRARVLLRNWNSYFLEGHLATTNRRWHRGWDGQAVEKAGPILLPLFLSD